MSTQLPPGHSPSDWIQKGLSDLTADQMELCRQWVARYGLEGPQITDERGVDVGSVLVMATPQTPGHFQLWLAGILWCHLLIDEAGMWQRIAAAVHAP